MRILRDQNQPELPGGVEQFRPKRHYPWLSYEWSNQLLACQVCSKYKGDRFPVEGQGATTPQETPSERPLLLDPTRERPDDHLVFHASSRSVKVAGVTKAGRTSIMVLGLNRVGLLKARGEQWLTRIPRMTR